MNHYSTPKSFTVGTALSGTDSGAQRRTLRCCYDGLPIAKQNHRWNAGAACACVKARRAKIAHCLPLQDGQCNTVHDSVLAGTRILGGERQLAQAVVRHLRARLQCLVYTAQWKDRIERQKRERSIRERQREREREKEKRRHMVNVYNLGQLLGSRVVTRIGGIDCVDIRAVDDLFCTKLLIRPDCC